VFKAQQAFTENDVQADYIRMSRSFYFGLAGKSLYTKLPAGSKLSDLDYRSV
jgi:hypothetical protein